MINVNGKKIITPEGAPQYAEQSNNPLSRRSLLSFMSLESFRSFADALHPVHQVYPVHTVTPATASPHTALPCIPWPIIAASPATSGFCSSGEIN